MKEIKPNNALLPPFLARNWESGESNLHESEIQNQINNKNDAAHFLIDPQGGIYFHNYEKMKDYSIIRNKFLMEILHLSSLYKTKIYKTFNNQYNAQEC